MLACEMARLVMWLGGMCGVGKTTAVTRVARRHDLWLYPMDARTLAHAELVQTGSLDKTPDELWLDRSPQEMADDFEADGRLRSPLVLHEIELLPEDGAPVLVEGSFLQPDLVGPAAVFVVASATLTSEMLRRRGSPAFECTRDPDAAHANRVRRDDILGERLRAKTPVVEITDIAETEPLVDGFVTKWAADWIARTERGDLGRRRCDENDRWLDQWRRYATVEPRAQHGTRLFACECGQRGCLQRVEVSLGEPRRPLLGH
jgi:hypothetical protein